jgi:hypothetical protein
MKEASRIRTDKKSPSHETTPPRTSLFPLFPSLLQHRFTGLALALLYCLILLVLGFRYHTVGDYEVETTFYWSATTGVHGLLLGTPETQDSQGPLYSVMLAGASLLTTDLFSVGIALAAMSAAAALLLTHMLFRRLLRHDLAFVGTLLVAANTVFVRYSYSVGVDMMFNALVLAAIVLIVREDTRRWATIGAAALLAACAYLTRYSGIAFLVAVPTALIAVNPHGQTLKDRLVTSGVFIGCFLIAISPWGIYTLLEKGSFFYNKNYLSIAYQMFGNESVSWDQFWQEGAAQYGSLAQVIVKAPILFLRTVFANVLLHGLNDLKNLTGWPMGAFSLCGMVLLVRERQSAHVWVFLLVSVFFFTMLLLLTSSERLSLCLLTPHVFLALKALSWRKLAAYRFWDRAHIGALLAGGLFVWTAITSFDSNARTISSGPGEVLSVAEWFRSTQHKTPEGTVVLARKPHIAYYLGMKLVSFPPAQTYADLLTEIKKSHASYVYYSLMEAGLTPQFQTLLDPRRAPQFLLPLTSTVSPPSVLYQVSLAEDK